MGDLHQQHEQIKTFFDLWVFPSFSYFSTASLNRMSEQTLKHSIAFSLKKLMCLKIDFEE
jgi:hypothetical protein